MIATSPAARYHEADRAGQERQVVPDEQERAEPRAARRTTNPNHRGERRVSFGIGLRVAPGLLGGHVAARRRAAVRTRVPSGSSPWRANCYRGPERRAPSRTLRAWGRASSSIDNYDSFTYNLVQALGELGCELVVHRNDAIDVAGVAALAPDAIVLSPGPGRPEDAGVTEHGRRRARTARPDPRACASGTRRSAGSFGGTIVAAPEIVHGKPSDGAPRRAPGSTTACRTRSSRAATTRSSRPRVAPRRPRGHRVDRRRRDGRAAPHAAVEGVQFHPESVLTDEGPRAPRELRGASGRSQLTSLRRAPSRGSHRRRGRVAAAAEARIVVGGRRRSSRVDAV